MNIRVQCNCILRMHLFLTIYNESEFAVFRLLNTTRRPASADRTARRQFQATGQPVSRTQASDAMTPRLPRYEAKCVQCRCFQCGSVPLRSHIKGTELPLANILTPLRHNWTFFATLTVEALQGKTCQDSLLSGEGRSLGAKISGGRSRPWGIFFLVSTKLDTFCYLTVENASCYVPSFWHNTGVWRTDGRTQQIKMIILNQVQVNLIYNTNRTLFL